MPNQKGKFSVSFRSEKIMDIDVEVSEDDMVLLKQDRDAPSTGCDVIVLHPKQIDDVVGWMLKAKAHALGGPEPDG